MPSTIFNRVGSVTGREILSEKKNKILLKISVANY